MPARLHLTDGETDWTADVAGDRVTIEGLEGVDESYVMRTDGQGAVIVESPTPVTGVTAVAGHVVWVGIDGEVFEFRVIHGAGRVKSPAHEQDALTPPMPATVARILVAPGDRVNDGDTLIALEAMKMELPIRAPRDGVVRAIHCREGDLVQPGTVLVEIAD